MTYIRSIPNTIAGEVSIDERYLYDIDPDRNYFNTNDADSVNFRPYTINELKDINIGKVGLFNIMHHNSRSILSELKLDEYNDMLNLLDDPFHIIGLTETWLNSTNVDTPMFSDYNHVYETRPVDGNFEFKERGGGISLFIRENIIFKKRNDLCRMLPYLELLFVEIDLNNKKYLIGVAYRIPNTNVELFIDEINSIIEPLKKNYEVILMGDFNICLLQDNNQTNNFRNTMQSNLLFPTIFEPTRVATVTREGRNTTTETLIDNIFVSDRLLYNSGTIYSSISDHYPVFISIPNDSSNTKTDIQEIKFRLIDEYRIRKFKSAIVNNSIIQSIKNIQSAETAFTLFFTTFNQLYDQYFPIKTKKVTKKSLLKPWVTESLAKRIKIKHNLARMANKGRTDKKTYTDFKNQLTTQLRIAKANYYEEEFSKNTGDIRGTWKVINSNIKNKVKSKNVVIKENDTILDQKDVPYKFNNFFTSIPNKLVNKITPVNVNATSFLRNRIFNSFFISPIVNKDIESAIKNLKSCNGVYTISTLVLNETRSVISDPLSYIYNLCTNQGYFPEELKTGCITPIYKKGDQHSIENYRPVCSLSQFSKILERIIYNSMIKFINKNNILTDAQYGFRANKSTESALIDFTDFVYKGLTHKTSIGAVFMDLSKAFDVMSHNILQSKLEHYGFRGMFLTFLMNFLKNRKYFVSVNGHQSNVKISNIGVPQGSTLGPLLFLLYVNDIVNCSEILKFILFADDTTILYKSHNIVELNTTLEIEANKVIEWFSANKLLINLTKTHTMLFSNKRGNPKLKINVQNIDLDEKEVVSFLGLEIDKKLTWKDHIQHICNKISKSIAILRLLKYSFPKHILKMIYMSLIYSYINYCNVIWGSAYECHLNPLIVLQKKAIRIINNSSYRDESLPIFYNLKLLPIPQIFKLNCLTFIFKCLINNNYPILRYRILQNSSSHSHATRYRDLLKPPFERLEICKRSYLYQSVCLWNKLDNDNKDSKSLDNFKNNIKRNLLEEIKPTTI